MTTFPTLRMRRLRRTEAIRRMVRETELRPDDLIYPLFVVPGTGQRQPIGAMPGQDRLSVDMLPAEAEELGALGIPAVLLFGIPESKDESGSGAYAERGIVQEAVRALKETVPELFEFPFNWPKSVDNSRSLRR